MSDDRTTTTGSAPPSRRHRTLDEARELVQQWRVSGQNQKTFCHSMGILRSTLDSCRRRTGDAVRRRRSQASSQDAARSAEAGFVQVVGPTGCPDGVSDTCLIVTTTDGIQIQVASAGQVELIAPVLAAVRQVRS